MNSEQEFLRQAFADLAAIRRAVERVGDKESYGIVRLVTLGTNTVIQVVALFCAIGFAAFEIRTDHRGTQEMLRSIGEPELRHIGITETGQLLIVVVVLLYVLVWMAARKAQTEFTAYVAKNFFYLKNFSFFSDLLVKYCVFALLMLSGNAQWVAPVFTLFIGDYLIQGRFFSLPVTFSLGAGLVCIFLAAIQFGSGSPNLLWPLLVFSVMSLCSIVYLYYWKRKYLEETIGSSDA